MSKTSHAKHEHKNKLKHQSDSYEKPHEDYKAGRFGHFLIALLIIGLGLFFVLPFYGLLPQGLQVAIIVIFILIVVLFGVFIKRSNKN